MIRQLLLSALLASSILQVSASTSVDHNISKGLPPVVKDQSIKTLQAFKGDFRILGSKVYRNDEQAKFSPIDYAVSWGLFAEPEIARHISVNQYDRYLNWKIDRLPVPKEQAMQMVSNMHINPANPDIAKVSATFGPFFLAIISGSGEAASIAFNQAVTIHAAELGMNPLDLGSLAAISGALGRTMSPLAGACIICAGFAKVNPLDLAKRNFPGMIVGVTVTMVVLMYMR